MKGPGVTCQGPFRFARKQRAKWELAYIWRLCADHKKFAQCTSYGFDNNLMKETIK